MRLLRMIPADLKMLLLDKHLLLMHELLQSHLLLFQLLLQFLMLSFKWQKSGLLSLHLRLLVAILGEELRSRG